MPAVGSVIHSDPEILSGAPVLGYQATTMLRFLDALQGDGVELLVDIRAVASSRRPGFSKTQLAASLREVGIEYISICAAWERRPDGRAKGGDASASPPCSIEQDRSASFEGQPVSSNKRDGHREPRRALRAFSRASRFNRLWALQSGSADIDRANRGRVAGDVSLFGGREKV